MPHSDEPLNPPVIQFRSLRAGEWLDIRYHVADVHDGRVIVAFDLDGYFDSAEIAQAGKELRQARRLGKKRESQKSTCKPDRDK